MIICHFIWCNAMILILHVAPECLVDLESPLLLQLEIHLFSISCLSR